MAGECVALWVTACAFAFVSHWRMTVVFGTFCRRIVGGGVGGVGGVGAGVGSSSITTSDCVTGVASGVVVFDRLGVERCEVVVVAGGDGVVLAVLEVRSVCSWVAA